MIKSALILSLVLSAFNCIAQDELETEFEHHCNFEERSITVGLGVPFAFETAAPGINLRVYFNIAEKICFGPEYSYFKNEDIEIVDFDFIGHYIFETKWVGIYPLVGANYTVETEYHSEELVTASLGLVMGAGVHRNFKYITVFVEYSRIELGINDQFIAGGLMYNFQ